MPLRFPRRSFHGGRTIDAFSLNYLPANDDQPNDPASVRFRSIAEILLRGIRRLVAEDRDLNADPERTSTTGEPVLGNLGDSLPEPLDFVSDRALSVSDVSKTPGFGDGQDIQNGGNS
ncbi:MAG TPA: hypothetical protein DDZ51_01450 [Planctomycetaceae bacterium]|nr:hypothetical protein [Planctomycetaceae bacterium]